MDTNKTNEKETKDLQTEDTSKNIKKKTTTTKKVPAKKETKADAENTKKVTKAKASKKESTKVAKTTTKTTKTKKTEDTVALEDAGKTVATAKAKPTKTTKAKKTVDASKEEKPATKAKASRTVTKKKNDEKSLKTKEVETTSEESAPLQTAEVETKEETTAPILEDIKRFKLFFVSDMDDEAVYLHDMSLQGYHFVTKKGMQYIFRQGEPKNYYYHLGYYEKDKKDGDRYVDNYLEAGWENIYHEKAEFDGVWNYFRIEMPIHEAEPNIFSDRVSRLALYKRLLSGWRSLLAVDVICFLALLYIYYSLSTHPSTMTGLFMTGCVLLLIVVVLVFIIYLRAYRKISKKQEELSNI
ncbi:DUF2812 domain-containing protein [Amedibacillus sp. YH-ame10]